MMGYKKIKKMILGFHGLETLSGSLLKEALHRPVNGFIKDDDMHVKWSKMGSL